jgi:protein SCO1/2
VRALPLLLAAGLLGSVTACGGSASPAPRAAAVASYHGVEPQGTVRRPEFVLTDTSGRAYDFTVETKGHPTFLYFGYTHCPDECPTAMADLAAALRKAPAGLRDGARVVFVTTDPQRDTAPVLRRWLDQFSAGFVGLLGTPAQLARAQTATGIQPAYPEGPVPTVSGHPDQHVHKPGTAPHQHFGPLGYSVAHSAVIFAYNAADLLPVVYPGGVTPSDIAADLPVLARP